CGNDRSRTASVDPACAAAVGRDPSDAACPGRTSAPGDREDRALPTCRSSTSRSRVAPTPRSRHGRRLRRAVGCSCRHHRGRGGRLSSIEPARRTAILIFIHATRQRVADDGGIGDMRLSIAPSLILAIAAALLLLTTSTARALPNGFSQVTVASGLNQPTAFAFKGNQIFVTEKASGQVRVVRPDGSLRPFPLLTVSVNSQSERGLLGIALDQDFETNKFLYICYT